MVVSAVMEKACPANGVLGGDVDQGGGSAHTDEAGGSFLTQTAAVGILGYRDWAPFVVVLFIPS